MPQLFVACAPYFKACGLLITTAVGELTVSWECTVQHCHVMTDCNVIWTVLFLIEQSVFLFGFALVMHCCKRLQDVLR